MVRIRRPPPTANLLIDPVYEVIPAGAELLRIYDPRFPGFKYWGPNARFDHHLRPAARPGIDSERATLYVARTLSCCVVETFGDTRIIEPGDLIVARLRVARDVTLLDLRKNGAMRAGTEVALAHAADHRLSQRWSRFFYTDPRFAVMEGIAYSSAHNEEDCIVLYERAELAIEWKVLPHTRLAHPSLENDLVQIALDNGLLMDI